MGGDAYYSAVWEKDLSKICETGIAKASLNCIFEWNQGLFADSKVKHRGVPFFKGSLHSLAGAGRLNGYDSYWQDGYPAHGQIYLISRLDMIMEGAKATWYDGTDRAYENPETPPASFGIVCEVQDGIVPTSTTTLPPKVVVPWVQEHWYAILLVVLLPLIAAIALIVVICCCCRRTDDKYTRAAPMELREVSGNVVYGTQERQSGGAGVSEDPVVFMRLPREQQHVLQRNPWMSPSTARSTC
ncbi:hypothetical protein TRSC58_06524 [Trypanosoma rangeli SC58]|uniref:Uncharacterized protein n=1 Tax=Trypanosoma rangeli SC58 TaxID=429131 RepID=A0A061ISH2_TRYRA|nr:hypothetical protein TRSC58_06524 [Trypanosoma rangeli SC58]